MPQHVYTRRAVLKLGAMIGVTAVCGAERHLAHAAESPVADLLFTR